MMVGRPVLFRLDKPQVEIGDPSCASRTCRRGRLDGVSLEVRAGEIVGVAGVEGNGQRELADAIMGLRPLDSAVGSCLGAGARPGAAPRRSATPGVGVHPRGPPRPGPRARHDAVGERRARPARRRRLLRPRRRPLHQAGSRSSRSGCSKRFDVRARSIEVTAADAVGRQPAEADPRARARAGPGPADRGATHARARRRSDRVRVAADPRSEGRGRAVLLISAELDEIYALSDRIVTLYEGRLTGRVPARRSRRGDRPRRCSATAPAVGSG